MEMCGAFWGRGNCVRLGVGVGGPKFSLNSLSHVQGCGALPSFISFSRMGLGALKQADK